MTINEYQKIVARRYTEIMLGSSVEKEIGVKGRYVKPDEEKMKIITKAYNEKMMEQADFNTYLRNTSFHIGQDLVEILGEEECNKLSEILRENGIKI